MTSLRASCLALCLSACPSLLAGQTPSTSPGATPRDQPASRTPNNKPQAAKPQAKKTLLKAEDDPLAAGRRSTAINMLTALADEARGFRDEALRARVQARAADALWEEDAERASALLRRAWEAAGRFDDEAERRSAEEIARQRTTAGGGTTLIPDQPKLRREVLRFAVRRDPRLAEEFLAELAEVKEEAAKKADAVAARDARETATSNFDPINPPRHIEERLNLAGELLDKGEAERALAVAAPALERPTMSGVSFLSTLRERNAVVADEQYRLLLNRTIADPSSDAVAVSLLSSYVLTPFTYVVVSRQGSMSGQMRAETRPADVPPALRALLFRVAAAVLTRPAPPNAAEDRTAAGRDGLYFTIRRLLPSFERYSPEHVPALQTQLAVLTPNAPEHLRDERNQLLTRGFVSNEADARLDGEESLERLDRASNLTTKERDGLRAGAVLALARQDDAKARALIDDITDADLRQRLRAHLDFGAVQNALRKKDAPEVIRLARKGELAPLFRVYALTEAVTMLKGAERDGASNVLYEALTEARRVNDSEVDRVRALTAVANAFFAFDRLRTWEILGEITKAADAAADYTGEDGQIASHIKYGGSVWMSSFGVAKFDLPALFALLVEDDFERAADAARNLSREAPRAVASLAVARAVLKEKKPVVKPKSDSTAS